MYGKFVEVDPELGKFEYGSFEVFYQPHVSGSIRHGSTLPRGWYWWPCYPGCLPDGEATGPFTTKEEAFRNARGDEA